MNATPDVRISVSYVSGRVEVEFLKSLPEDGICSKLKAIVNTKPRVSVHIIPPWVVQSRKIQDGFWFLYKPEWEVGQPKVTQESIEQGSAIARACLNTLVADGFQRHDIEVSGNIHRM